jgi:hypothetical protein
MRKFAIAAASLATVGLMSAQPAAADITLDVCFHILDQLEIVAGEDMCDAVVEATLIESNQGPYVIELDADGNLLCTALEVKYVNGYSPIYGTITFDPIVPGVFTLNMIGPDAAACGTE